MRQPGSGAIIHVPARPETDPTAGMAAYSLSKAALGHLIRILDLELRPHGIRVTAVAPQASRTSSPFLVSDRASPLSGAVVPAYGAQPGRNTPCHLP